MTWSAGPAVRRFASDQCGQILPVVAVMLVALLLMTGLVVDVGRLYISHRQLQTSTDAAALAGAQSLPSTTGATAAALAYSSVAGNKNVYGNLPGVTMVSGYPLLRCLSTLTGQGMECVAPANSNSITVMQQVTIPVYFAWLFGKRSFTLTASSTASMRGANPSPYNVAIIVDTTLSMNAQDSNCGATQMMCALNGVKIFLQTLSPCAADQPACTISDGVSANSVDRVSLFTFPNVTIATAATDSNCTTPIPSPNGSNGYYNISPYGNLSLLPASPWSGVPTAVPYSFPAAGATSYTPSGSNSATYQLTSFLSDYRLSDTSTTLNPGSALVKAAGGTSNCGSMLPANFDGDYGTYFAGAIYAAQAALVAAQVANPGSKNVIILLGDGDANVQHTFTSNGVTVTGMPSPATNSGTYPSYVNECGQAVTAGQFATDQGTKVYTVAYGASSTGCNTDSNPGTDPCTTLQSIASSPQEFYSDYTATGGDGSCISTAHPGLSSLNQIFASIAGSLTYARLIPDNTP